MISYFSHLFELYSKHIFHMEFININIDDLVNNFLMDTRNEHVSHCLDGAIHISIHRVGCTPLMEMGWISNKKW